MDVDEVVKKIPGGLIQSTAETLLDILLASSKAVSLPAQIGKAILSYAQADTLTSEAGLKLLLQACTTVEKEKTMAKLEALGLRDAAAMLRTS